MGAKGSDRKLLNLEIYDIAKFFVWFVLIYTARFSFGNTNPVDVAAINTLYASLGSPVLPGWVASAGDPCGEGWQGVLCNVSNIQSIVLNGANLGGELGNGLSMFTSIQSIDVSSNHIGGSIPANLPATLQSLFLAANNFTGSIPDSVASLTLLSAMSLNDNSLSGEIPDVFQSLPGLINLDLSNNNLSGELPSSFQSLPSLTTLRLQDNQLSGTLDVLQDLPLRDLNIENNLFTGPIPAKMLAIPSFRRDGNPFNTSTSPVPSPTPSITLLPPPPPPSPLPSGSPPSPPSPSSKKTPGKHADGPSSPVESNPRDKKFLTTKKVVCISIAGVFLLVITALALVLFVPACCRRREEAGRFKRHQVGAYKGNRENLRDSVPPVQPTNQTQNVPKETLPQQVKEDRSKPQKALESNVRRMDAIPKREDHEIDMSRLEMMFMPPPPPPPPPPLAEKVIVNPIVPSVVTTAKPSGKSQTPLTSARAFTIASLQQYTNSFSEDNLIGGGVLGSVYRAQLPDGKLLAVKKLDKKVASQDDAEFIELVNNIDRIRHANVVELMGYCAEHGQKLLIYEYCSNGTLQDALHSYDELQQKLSWNARIRMTLGAARALEYLHEVYQPPVVHRNFKSANILLDKDLAVRVSDCGLAPLMSSGSVSQLSGQLLTAYGYGAPEIIESGFYTAQSDVFSFGVVMLELLTGRKSYDRNRNRGEQSLVRWAIPQLHDIDKLSKMVDPSLNGKISAKSLSNFADIISRCVQAEPEFRPPMSEVVQDLTDMIRRDRSSNESVWD